MGFAGNGRASLLERRIHVVQGLGINGSAGFTLIFRPDLSFLIEENRRRSRATLRILRLKGRQRWQGDEM
jgi:hypothetical protein